MKKFYKYGIQAGFIISIVSFFITLILSFFITFLEEGNFYYSDPFFNGFFSNYLFFLSVFSFLWLIISTIRTFFILKKTDEKSRLIYISNFLVSYFSLFILQFIYIVAFAFLGAFLKPS